MALNMNRPRQVLLALSFVATSVLSGLAAFGSATLPGKPFSE